MIFISQAASAAFERTNQGGRSVAMGGASVSLPHEVWASFSNAGSLPTINQRVLSLSYSPQRFGLPELARGSFSFVEPTSFGTFALSGQRFGFELYREVTAGLSYGRSIVDGFFAGLVINYYSLAIQNYGSAGTIGVDVGILTELSSQVWWGATAFNLNSPTIGRSRESLPQVYSTGVAYQPIPEAVLSLALVKDIRYASEFQIGIEYSIIPGVALRGGMSSEPSILNAGIGVRYAFVQLDYAFSESSDLGLEHQISISLMLGDL